MHHHRASKGLFLSFLITMVFAILEVVGGLISGSLALLSDSVDMFIDASSLLIAIFAQRIAQRAQNNDLMTYGYKRVEIIAGFFSTIVLVFFAIQIAISAIQRLIKPQEINIAVVLPIAVAGFLVNLFVVILLFRGSRESLNIRSAFLHVFGDLLGSAGVITSTLLITATGWLWLDPTVSLLIVSVILFSSYKILKEIFRILLEAHPKHFQKKALIYALRKEFPQIKEIHDYHAWQIDPHQSFCTFHICLLETNAEQETDILKEIKAMLKKNFGIDHSVIQIDRETCADQELGLKKHCF